MRKDHPYRPGRLRDRPPAARLSPFRAALPAQKLNLLREPKHRKKVRSTPFPPAIRGLRFTPRPLPLQSEAAAAQVRKPYRRPPLYRQLPSRHQFPEHRQAPPHPKRARARQFRAEVQAALEIQKYRYPSQSRSLLPVPQRPRSRHPATVSREAANLHRKRLSPPRLSELGTALLSAPPRRQTPPRRTTARRRACPLRSAIIPPAQSTPPALLPK